MASWHETLDPRFLQGIEHFNVGDFFEAHEVWESVWAEEQGPSRRFYQGLIQVAVCLYHFNNGNTAGARKLYHSSCNYLRAYTPWHLGVNVDQLIADLTRCCDPILRSDKHWPEVTLDPETVPQIQLAPPPGEAASR